MTEDSEIKAKKSKYPNGHRYEVSLAKIEEPNCYVGFHWCDTLVEAERVCVEKSVAENRECIVWDYEPISWFAFRNNPAKKEVKDDTPKPESKPKPKLARKPTIKRGKST